MVVLCQESWQLVNREKSELVPKQVSDFVGYQLDLKAGKDQMHHEALADFNSKDPNIIEPSGLSSLAAHVPHRIIHHREAGPPSSTPYIVLIQWHLKNNLRVPEPPEKVIHIPSLLHPNIKWWMQENNVLQSEPLHPLKHAL